MKLITSSLLLFTFTGFVVSAPGTQPSIHTWNTFLRAKDIFPVDHTGTSSLKNLGENKAGEGGQENFKVLNELEKLLSQDELFNRIFVNYVENVLKSKDSAELLQSADRKEIFKNQLMTIARHNLEERAGRVTWFQAVTAFTHLTTEEFQEMYLGKLNNEDATPVCQKSNEEYTKMGQRSDRKFDTLNQAPVTLNWREKGIVPPPKDQGPCGTCYAFSTVAILESAYAKAHGKLISLSEEDIRDCSTETFGCGGGYQFDALRYIKGVGGLPLESEYSYFNNNTTYPCTSKGLQRHANIASYGLYESHGDETQLIDAIYNFGPVGVLVDARAWPMNYGGGLYKAPCNQSLDHAVTVVGYTEEAFIVKNSWGTWWGAEGFMLLPRGYNDCGVANCIAYISEMA